MRRTAQDIVQIGQKLIEVKQRLGYGRFLDWLDGEFDWSWDTAKRFMRVAEVFGQNQQFADFNVAPSALYELAAPSTPEAARTEAIARAEAGESITYSTAKEIKKKYAFPTAKPRSKTKTEMKEVPAVSPTVPTPLPSPVPSSRSEIIAIRPAIQSSTAEIAGAEATASVTAPQTSQPASPESPGIWWQLGGRHFLFCGQPNADEFMARIPNNLKLLLAFPPASIWRSRILAEANLILTDYLPIFQNSELLDAVLETLILSSSSTNDVVVCCFVPSPDILSVISRFERQGLLVEPNSRRCSAIVADWNRAGLKVERVS